jgi:predicted transcriptional regulator
MISWISSISDMILARCESHDIDPEIIEALKAQMADMESGGKTYAWEDVEEWMDSWFTDHEKPEPQCQP